MIKIQHGKTSGGAWPSISVQKYRRNQENPDVKYNNFLSITGTSFDIFIPFADSKLWRFWIEHICIVKCYPTTTSANLLLLSLLPNLFKSPTGETCKIQKPGLLQLKVVLFTPSTQGGGYGPFTSASAYSHMCPGSAYSGHILVSC